MGMLCAPGMRPVEESSPGSRTSMIMMEEEGDEEVGRRDRSLTAISQARVGRLKETGGWDEYLFKAVLVRGAGGAPSCLSTAGFEG